MHHLVAPARRCSASGAKGRGASWHCSKASGEIGVVSFECPVRRVPVGGGPSSAGHPARARPRSLFGLKPSARPIPALLDLGFWDVTHPLGKARMSRGQARLTSSCRPKAKPCTRSRSARSMPASSSPGISASPPTARPSSGWNSGSATCIRASIADGRRDARHRRASLPAAPPATAPSLTRSLLLRPSKSHFDDAPPRAIYLRALMAELERLANHFGDIGAICNDASFSLDAMPNAASCASATLRAAHACFGHRLMMDVIVPGGVARDIGAGGRAGSASCSRRSAGVSPTDRALRQHRLAAGSHRHDRLSRAELARAVRRRRLCRARLGPRVRRAQALAYAPYDRLDFEVPVLDAGDVNARVWIRIREVEQSLGLIEQILDGCRGGELQRRGRLAERACARAWLSPKLFAATCSSGCGSCRGAIARCHLRDPSWFQWPLLEAAIEGNIVADFPLCNKSFNCSYSGHDL